MKKSSSTIVKTLLTLLFCLIGAVFIWLASQYSISQASAVFQSLGRWLVCS